MYTFSDEVVLKLAEEFALERLLDKEVFSIRPRLDGNTNTLDINYIGINEKGVLRCNRGTLASFCHRRSTDDRSDWWHCWCMGIKLEYYADWDPNTDSGLIKTTRDDFNIVYIKSDPVTPITDHDTCMKIVRLAYIRLKLEALPLDRYLKFTNRS